MSSAVLTQLEEWYYTGQFENILESSSDDPFVKSYQITALTSIGKSNEAVELSKSLQYLLNNEDPFVSLVYLVSDIDASLKIRNLDEVPMKIDNMKNIWNSIDEETKSKRITQKYYGRFIRLYGVYKVYIGDFSAGTDKFSEAISIFQQNHDNNGLTRALLNRAASRYWLGDIDDALQDALNGFEYVENSINTENYVGITNNTGLIYFSKNKLKKALKFFHLSYEGSKMMENQAYIALNLHNLIRTLDLLERHQEAAEYLDRMENLDQSHPLISLLTKLSIAIFNLSTKRFQKLAKGQKLLNEIIFEDKVIDYQFVIMAIYYSVDYLIKELEFANQRDDEIIGDIETLLNRISDLAHIQSIKPAYIQSQLIRSRLQLLNGDFQKAKALLEDGLELAKDLNLNALQSVINLELDELERDIDHLKSIDDTKFIEQAQNIHLFELIREVRNNQLITQYQIKEQPLFLIFMNNAGIPIYSRTFPGYDVKFNEYLISGFITAIDIFGKETFGESTVERLDFHGYHILLNKSGEIYISYAYKNISRTTNRRFGNMIAYLKSIHDINQYFNYPVPDNNLMQIPDGFEKQVDFAVKNFLLPHLKDEMFEVQKEQEPDQT